MTNRRDFLLALAGASASAAAIEADVLMRDIELPTPDPARALRVRVLAPAGRKTLPLVVFSHGAYSSGRLYDPILTAWAAAGFAVLAPTHRDSVSLGVQRGSNDPRYFRWRLEDMELLLGSLDEVARRVPDLARRWQRARVAATGHSFGGLVAQTLSGATYFDPLLGHTVSRSAKNIRATLIFSGAGRFAPLLRSEDFATLRKPLLVTVGTEDLQQAPGLTGYRWRREPFDLATARPRYLLTLQGADHYLGGVVGRDDLALSERAGAWLRAFNTASIFFLRRHLAGQSVARPEIAAADGRLEQA